MKACPFRFMGVKGAVAVEEVACLGEQCALYREYSSGPGKVEHACAFVAAGSDSLHLRDQIGAIAQLMRASATRR